MENSMSNLYEIATAFRAEADKLADLDLDEQTLQDTLEGMTGELEAKAQNTAFVVRNIEATAAAIKEAEAQMAARRKALENRAARIKDYLLANMLIAGVQKIECPYFKLAVRENPPAVEIYEPGLIPAQFIKTPEPPPPSPDKSAIKAAIQSGVEVPGCTLTRGMRIEIK
jgi:hypothetical protein